MNEAPHRMALPGDAVFALQSVVWPGSQHPRPALVLRLFGPVTVLPLGQGLRLDPMGGVRLDTAHNIFALEQWRRAGLTDLRLVLEGSGTVTLTVTGETAPKRKPVTQTHRLELPATLGMRAWIGRAALLHMALTAETAALVSGLTWATTNPPRRLPHLALTITTFHREAEVRRGIERFAGRAAQLADFLDLIVIDNGQTLEPVSLPRIRVIPNRNLGGAGGFARGMAEARAIGATHCLFMDDDASLDTSGLTRIWTFLAHATDPRTAVAGALMSAEFPTELWENGATFAGAFRPISRGLDLADPVDLFKAEFNALKPRRNFYGGFWCYAFPLDHVTHAPFPFFVRGDDTSFCIANRFANVTLPGVLCHQEVDFTEKESSLTLYLDLRSNLIHLATLPQNLRLIRSLRLITRFFGRSLMQHQVDSLGGLNAAVEDFLAGPEALEPDLATRRASLAAARQSEVWREMTAPIAPPRRFNPQWKLTRIAFALGLNGLLLPGFEHWGDRIVLTQKQRGVVRWCWGAAEIAYVSTDGQRVMQLRLNRRATWGEGFRMLRNLGRLVWNYGRLRREWAAGYARMTRADWWDQFRGSL